MGSNKKLLLVHAGMQRQFLSHDVNVMLTPQYYTMKREELPVKYLYQAKKIAASLFDGLLEEVGEYSYMVYKEKKVWVFIAYSSGQIHSLLLSKGISPERVSKIFFAQQAVDAFSSPVLLKDEKALIAMNDTVVVVPKSALEEKTKIVEFTEKFAPKLGISLQGSIQSLLSIGQTITLACVFLLFSGIFFIEGARYAKSSLSTENEMQELLKAYPSLQSKLQRESISEKYKTIDRIERKKREIIKSLSGLIFKGSTLTALYISEKEFKSTFACDNKIVIKRLNQLAKKEHFIKVKTIGNSVVIEGAL
jgi:hypothetical protein